MPQCKAKFCTVRRVQGISTFPIPNPKKNKELCETWINKLGIENLNIRTFQFSRDSIVCAQHFEEDCFKEDIQAKIMGYQPKYRYLKDNAVPTIFRDSIVPKTRETSRNRLEKKTKNEMLTDILERTDIPTNDSFDDRPTTSVDQTVSSMVIRKRKQLQRKPSNSKLSKVTHQYVDVGVQVKPAVLDASVSCKIQIDTTSLDCSNCYIRENPNMALSDHMYTPDIGQNSSGCFNTSTPVKKITSSNNDITVDDYLTDDFETPPKVYKADPDFTPSYDSDTSSTSSPKLRHDHIKPEDNTISEQKFIVFSSCLIELFALVSCSVCRNPMDVDDIRKRYDGTSVTFSLTCLQGHSFMWRSQPILDQQPAGNILTTAASVLIGGTFASLDNFAKTLKLQFMSKQTYHKIENDLVIPVIDSFWNKQKGIIRRNMIGRNLTVAGDGRCDSPGFSAKYCTYTIMETKTSAILGFNVTQVTETGSSTRMELEGFKKTMHDIQGDGLSIASIATDRHVQIRKHMKDEFPNTSHQFDVWHMSKSIRKKLLAAAKKKGNEDLMPWVKSISNHIWYCASNCNGDPDLLVEMWTSVINHIQNIHTFEGDQFTKCGHAELLAEEIRKKKWLKADQKAFKALRDIVCNKRLLKDIRQLNLFCHTGDLESYHSMMLKYVPKRLAFKYPQMVARTRLAALDYNFNLKRAQATDAEGNPQFSVNFPKATGRWSVRKLYCEKNYDFRQEMMGMTVTRKLSGLSNQTPHQIKIRELPRNIAPVPAPPKSELIESHVSRFKINQD